MISSHDHVIELILQDKILQQGMTSLTKSGTTEPNPKEEAASRSRACIANKDGFSVKKYQRKNILHEEMWSSLGL